ncbi:MAG: penicillin-binding protein [Bryobacteraceae bacterium]
MESPPLAPLSKSVNRLLIMSLVLAAWVLLILGRLFQLQVLQHDKYLSLARRQQERLELVPALRGTIYDSTGTLLAINKFSKLAIVNPTRIPDKAMAAGLLSSVLPVPAQTLQTALEETANSSHPGFLVVSTNVTKEQADALGALNLEWLELRDGTTRWYPNHQLAAHVIGNVNFDGIGVAGIEKRLNQDLTGEPGQIRVAHDVYGQAYEQEQEKAPQNGKNITLTIDARLQDVAEAAIQDAVVKNHAEHGSLVAMDPYTGEVKALANYPTYDLDERLLPGQPATGRENLAVMAPFEPGSVFKVITLSAALQTTTLTPLSVINCGNGSIRIGSRVIKDHKSYSSLAMQDVLAFSSNVGAIRIGMEVGNENLYNYIRLFGFGQRTGIELPAEAPGMLRPLRRWQQGSIGSVAMGHEISVTSVQLAQAGSVIANGGFRVAPRVVQFKQVPGGPKEIVKEPERVRVLEPANVVTMRQMMERVVIYPGGTGRRAKVIGYTTAGKTGTAQIFDFQHHVYTHKYNASFMGFVPVVNPRIVIAVTVTGTTGEVGYGGVASAPAFQRVAEVAMRLIGVPRDMPDDVKLQEPKHRPANEDNDLSIAELGDPLTPEDWKEGLGDSEGAISETAPAYNGPVVPKLTGMTELEVVKFSAEKGLLVEVTGHGLAVDQQPAPGAPLSPGERIRVKFRRL